MDEREEAGRGEVFLTGMQSAIAGMRTKTLY